MKGRVHSIKGKTVSIIPENTGCFGCMGGECGKRLVLVNAENGENLPLAPGRIVEADTEAGAALGQGLFALLLPAAGFAAGFLLAGLITAEEAARAAGGFLAMLACAFACFLFRRRFPPRGKTVIRRIVAE
ncbi:MAG: SoxR reducing system RseC family protein [Treponema sp.]|jgi:positive regulator of sigma E activity|nr:SoxR reducing system RseC family protein [Treponema sp.]